MSADSLLSPALVAPPGADTRRRLTEALAPGRRRLAASAAMTTAAVAATAAGFFAIAAVAQDVLERHASWAHESGWLLLLAGAAAVRAACGYLAARLAMDGALAVEQQLRARLLDRLIGGAGSSLPSAAQATAVMDEVDRVGSYAERYQPARVAATLVPLVLLAAVFPLNWLVGVLLVLCAPLPPVNLSIVGMGTAAVARRHAEELRHLSGYFLDRLRGLATLRALGAEQAELERVKAASRATGRELDGGAAGRVHLGRGARGDRDGRGRRRRDLHRADAARLHADSRAPRPHVAAHRAVPADGHAAVLPAGPDARRRLPRARRRARRDRGAPAAPRTSPADVQPADTRPLPGRPAVEISRAHGHLPRAASCPRSTTCRSRSSRAS